MSLYLPYVLEYNLETISPAFGRAVCSLIWRPEVYSATPGQVARAEASLPPFRKNAQHP